MKVYICEKPDQAAKLAKVLGIDNRRFGYYEGCGTYVTWAIGHLLELYSPQEYDPVWKKWDMATLPIVPETWKRKVTANKQKQFKVISTLLKEATEVVLACDFDREGEAIACSIVDHCRYKGKRSRLKLRALDKTSIQRALDDVVDASETRPLYHAALARQRADWLVGMNLTRLYTTLVQQAGGSETMNIGRVLTPTVNLVCQRDTEIRNFTSHPFYLVQAQIQVASGIFTATWKPSEAQGGLDEEGRCIDEPLARTVINKITGQPGRIAQAETKASKENAPLPFDLASIQKHASTHWGMSSQRTLEVCQSLYDKEVLSYPRVDCRYIPVSQFQDAPHIMNALARSDSDFGGICSAANLQSAPRCFNDGKVTAHHAIIPTMEPVDISTLSSEEMNVYDAVRRSYVAQFYPAAEYNLTRIEAKCCGEVFLARGKVPLKPGWKMIFREPEPEGNSATDESPDVLLPAVHTGENTVTTSADLETKNTRPPPHYTEATLLGAMENVARFVEDEKLKKILKENSGIGTPATRASIIQGAIDRSLLQRDKKTLIATKKAYVLVGLVAPMLASPAMTAAWEQKFESVVDGSAEHDVVVAQIGQWISQLVTRIKDVAPDLTTNMKNDPLIGDFLKANTGKYVTKTAECFTCGGVIKRFQRKDKKNHFWKCQEEACGMFFNDVRSKPVKPVQQPTESPSCPLCKEAMVLKVAGRGKAKGSSFWSCSQYKQSGCKGTLPHNEKPSKTPA